jgi:hypothetical protein
MLTPTENLSKDTASVVDSLSAMIQKELTTYSDKGYYLLDPSESTIVVTSEDRMALVDWCYGVVDHYQFSRESVASAMEMVDRFLSMPNNNTTVDEALRDQNKFQLLIVTALYVSIKANEHVVISSDVFAEMSRIYTVEEIEDMERKLLCGLSWRCYAPTTIQVGHAILSLMFPYTTSEATWCFLMDEMKYQTEHAVRDYYFSTKRPSTVAMGALFNCIRHITGCERHELLESFLCIIECFDFDQPKLISAASKRLDSLLQDSQCVTEEKKDVEHEEPSKQTETEIMNSADDGMKQFPRIDLREVERLPEDVANNIVSTRHVCGCKAA